MTIKDNVKRRVCIQEILLCASVLSGENDCILAVPVGEVPINKKSLRFQGLYLVLDATSFVASDALNSTRTKLMDSCESGMFHVNVIRYFTQERQQYAIVCIHINQTQEERKTAAVFGFQYWWKVA